jgi:hypothetical protein
VFRLGSSRSLDGISRQSGLLITNVVNLLQVLSQRSPSNLFDLCARGDRVRRRPHAHSGLEGKPWGGALEGFDCCFVNGGDDSIWPEGACSWQPVNTMILTARATAMMVRTFGPKAILSCLPEREGRPPPTARRGIHGGSQAAAIPKATAQILTRWLTSANG